MIYQAETGNFTIALAGDTMLTRKLTPFTEPRFLALREILRSADAAFANLEGTVHDWDEGTPGITQGTFMTTDPNLLEDLKWLGINLICCANNHAFDYGEGGVLANIKHLDRAGLAHAGTGKNLAEARAPAYLDTPNGRVALVATTATFRPWNQAGEQRPDLRGRPGINPLGFQTTHRVDPAAFEQLKRISRELGFEKSHERARKHFYSDKEIPDAKSAELSLLGSRFVGSEGVLTVGTGVTVSKTPRESEPGYTIDTFPQSVQEQFLAKYREKYPQQAANADSTGVPGAENWHLAPLSMRWQDMNDKILSSAEICKSLTDRSNNDNMDGTALLKHHQTEPLVHWAFQPGRNRDGTARSLPPLSHDQLVAAIRTWVEAGMPCPQNP